MPRPPQPDPAASSASGSSGGRLGAAKASARNARLSWNPSADEKVRKQVKAYAQKQCADEISAFAACVQDSGLRVTSVCVPQHDTMTDCMKAVQTKKTFLAFKRNEIERRKRLIAGRPDVQ